ncbi:hypothetical protein [Nocardioides sp. URHA0020]|uniref:hypothetical protein n=1 Tax=Nocardioides sp. URHA0020 TaxID=1380392 RepID=UPI000490FE6F|nr:hypothetical protein [Nocardioides sp. URHA0020]
MVILAVIVASVLLLGLIVWTGTKMVAHPDPDAVSVGGAMGAGLGVFDPGAARAREDIDDQKNQTEVVPSPDEGDDPVWKVDLRRGTVKIPRPPR